DPIVFDSAVTAGAAREVEGPEFRFVPSEGCKWIPGDADGGGTAAAQQLLVRERLWHWEERVSLPLALEEQVPANKSGSRLRAGRREAEREQPESSAQKHGSAPPGPPAGTAPGRRSRVGPRPMNGRRSVGGAPQPRGGWRDNSR